MVNQSQFIERYGNSPKQCIGDIAKEWSKGQPFKKDNIIESGSTPCIHYGELFTKYGPYIDDVCSTTNDAAMKVSQVGDILFPASDVTPNGLTRCSAIMRSGVLLGGDIIILRLREGLSPEYTSYAICMQKQQLLECITGSVIKHLSAKSILNVKVPIPANRKDQDAFVAIMRQADKSKFAGFKSQFISQFGNPVTNPMGWPTKPICQVAPESPSTTKMKGRVWVLNLDMIESNSGNIINKVFEDSEDLNSVAAFDEGNVLFSKLRPYLNKVTIPDEKGYATTELVPLRPHTEVLRQYFLSFLLRMDEFVKYADGIATGTKMPRMPMTALREFKCILPPTKLQDKFCGISKQADKSKYLN